jgi:hypothetical protein
MYVCACAHVHARVCAFAHFLDGFAPKLVEIFLGSNKLAWLTWFVCVREHVREHVRYMRVHIRTFTYKCVHICLDKFAPKLVEAFLCTGYMLCTCTLACAHNACIMRVCALHACARSHIIGPIHSKLGGIFYWSWKAARYVMCARISVHVCVVRYRDGFATNLVETLYGSRKVAWDTWFVHTCLRVLTMRLCAIWGMHVCILTFLDEFASHLAEMLIIWPAPDGNGLVWLNDR